MRIVNTRLKYRDYAEEDRPMEVRTFSWRFVLSLVAIEIGAIGAFVWMVMG